MTYARKLRLARRLRKYNVRRPLLVLNEAKRAGLRPAYALALIEKEVGHPARNIFGCDWGSASGPPYCHQAVTKDRVRALLASGKANGVGYTQLTYRPFVLAAERMGGAHRPKYQMRVGFKLLADLIRSNGVQDGFRAYNGSGPDAEAYGRHAVQLALRWRTRLRK